MRVKTEERSSSKIHLKILHPRQEAGKPPISQEKCHQVVGMTTELCKRLKVASVGGEIPCASWSE